MNNLLLRFTVEPSFPDEASVKLTLCKNDDKWILYGQHGHMFQQKDVEKNIPVPRVKSIFDELKKVNVPSIPQFAIGVDGTTYQLEVEHGFNSATYRWWGNTPDEYRVIMQICEALLTFAEIEIEIA